MVLERRARGPPRGPLSKRAPGGFGGQGGVLQEAPGQKGPLVVLEARAGSSKRPLVKKGPWWFWRPGRGPPRGPWPKRAPGGFGGQGGVLQEAPGQKGPLMVLEARAGSSKRPLAKKGP